MQYGKARRNATPQSPFEYVRDTLALYQASTYYTRWKERFDGSAEVPFKSVSQLQVDLLHLHATESRWRPGETNFNAAVARGMYFFSGGDVSEFTYYQKSKLHQAYLEKLLLYLPFVVVGQPYNQAQDAGVFAEGFSKDNPSILFVMIESPYWFEELYNGSGRADPSPLLPFSLRNMPKPSMGRKNSRWLLLFRTRQQAELFEYARRGDVALPIERPVAAVPEKVRKAVPKASAEAEAAALEVWEDLVDMRSELYTDINISVGKGTMPGRMYERLEKVLSAFCDHNHSAEAQNIFTMTWNYLELGEMEKLQALVLEKYKVILKTERD